MQTPHSAASRLGDGPVLRALRAPRGFREVGGVREAWPCESPFSRTPTGRTAAQKAGLRYERKVHEYLASVFCDAYSPSQWFGYYDVHGSRRFCQPDGILRFGNVAVIFEVKARFTGDGWWQLRRLYAPIVRVAFAPSLLGLCLICRSYDPSVPFPERHDVLSDVERWVVRREFAQVGVFPWRG